MLLLLSIVIAARTLTFGINISLRPECWHGNITPIRIYALVNKKSPQLGCDQIRDLRDVLQFGPRPQQ